MKYSWSMQDARLVWHHDAGDIYWTMPEGYDIPSDAVLSLAEFLLLAPFGETVEVLSRQPSGRGRTAVAFSGGVDSAAVLELLEDPMPIHTQVARPGGLHRIENALLAVDEVDGLAVVSNQDQLPTFYGRPRGFYGTAGWTVTSVLLAEHFNLSVFADGNILEFVYLRTSHGHGTGFQRRDFSATLAAFRRVGLEYSMPAAGLTEVQTTRIAANYRYAMGCMRGVEGQPCLNCMKCYRKRAIQGNPIQSNPEAEKILGKEWIPLLGSLLWARDNSGLSHPRLDDVQLDYSWVDKWYPQSIEYVPEQLREYFTARLKHFSVDPLEDVDALHRWSAQVGV